MFKGLAKGILSSGIYEHSGKGHKKGLFPGMCKSDGIMNRTKYYQRERVFEFYTTHVGSFSVAITKTGQTAEWDFGDGQRVVGNSATITYAAAGTKKVRLLVDDFKLVTAISSLFNINIVGELDLRAFVNCTSFQIYDNQGVTKLRMPRPSKGVVQANNNYKTYRLESLDISMMENMSYFAGTSASWRRGINFPKSSSVTYWAANATELRYLDLSSMTQSGFFLCQNNTSLISVLFAPSSGSFSQFFFSGNTAYAGNLDLSMFTGLAGDIRLNTNTLMTSITNPTSSGVITRYYAHTSGITGTLDLSGLTGLGGDFRCNANSLMTAITLPSSNQTFTFFYVHQSGLTGTLNCSGLTGLGGDFQAWSNTGLTAITLPTNTKTFTTFYAYSCAITTINFTATSKLTEVNNCTIRLENNGMSSAQVDQILIDLDSIATNAFTGRSITINGTNAAPGAAGLVAKTSLVTKGFTVSTN